MFFLLCTFEREDLKKLHDVLAKISKYFRNTICILDYEKNESTESGKYFNKLLEIIIRVLYNELNSSSYFVIILYLYLILFLEKLFIPVLIEFIEHTILI